MQADQTNENIALRKAAIVVASLEPSLAMTLLDAMEPDDAMRVRSIAESLDAIDADEQAAILRDFVRANSGASTPKPTTKDAMPFEFLHGDTSARFTPLLKKEHPQTIAIVMAHLPPDRAAEVLAALEPDVQAVVVDRLLALGQTDPDVVREVERGLETRLQELVQHEQQRAAGTAVVADILSASDVWTRDTIMARLAHASKDTPPAPQVDRHPVFADVEQLPNDELAALLNVSDAKVTELALAGASRAMLQRVLRLLEPGEAKRFQRRLERLGPIRLSDVEQAQLELARLADTLAARRHGDCEERSTLAAAA
ncbi:MAG TPA: FliG C-terminal domain-containing protein [Pirellulales bacterium]|jgi:flagellar motor switch protein FliG|nr:FliG C-terminal domain-containing protein [Pirellulales bacterium]